jgi:hypothetical protein|tara:strand:+ start:4778 stop:5356 length:579 start_codon:yes stop_codon:yes gene_type:complete
MKGTFYFLIKPKTERYNNIKKIGDKELILNSEIFNHQYISREAVVVGVPSEFNTPIEEGDEIIIHHNVFRRWHDARGKERNSSSYIKKDLYKVSINQVFAYKKIVEWKALPGYSFIKPIQKKDGSEADQIGIVKYSDGSFKKGELVGYNSAAEYEFVINKERLYRVPNIFIEIKYEYKGKEKEYNPSWLQSG